MNNDNLKQDGSINFNDEKKEINVLDLSNTNISASLLNKEKNINDINTIQLDNIVTPTKINDIVETKNEYKEYVVKSKNNNNLLFIVILLLIIAIFLGVVLLYILPFLENKKVTVNTVTKTTTKLVTYEFESINISDNIITSSGEFKINEKYTIKTIKNNNTLDIKINDNYLTTKDRLFNIIGTIDNLLILTFDNSGDRTATLMIINQDGEIIKELDDIGITDMKIENIYSSISFTNGYIAITASRVNKDNLYVNNTMLNVCDSNELSNNGIDDNFMVIGTYKVSYNGDKTFSDPILLNSVSLSQYKETEKSCN